jgi:hypothetical protein
VAHAINVCFGMPKVRAAVHRAFELAPRPVDTAVVRFEVAERCCWHVDCLLLRGGVFMPLQIPLGWGRSLETEPERKPEC